MVKRPDDWPAPPEHKSFPCHPKGTKLVLYLAGPMDGCSVKESTGWRKEAIDRLKELYDIRNPMIRDWFKNDYNPRVHEPLIVEGDKGDIEAADVVLANCWQRSFGTPMEIFYARSLRKYVLAVVPQSMTVNGFASPWVSYHSNRVVSDLES